MNESIPRARERPRSWPNCVRRRARFLRERPGPEQLMESGDYEGPYRQGNVMALLTGIAELKRQREERGLSLADVSERSGLDRGMLSRLENGKILNPTMATLWRYADAIGSQVSLGVEPLPIGPHS